jgi:hypothetical protein
MRWEDKPTFETERAFVEAFERLARAGMAYDIGHLSEAPNLAKEVATFVYDHGAITSVLSQLDIKQKIDFIDSSFSDSTDGPATDGLLLSNEYFLIDACIGFSGMDYRPRLGRGESRAVSFDTWWSGPVLSRYVHMPAGDRETISRSELILHVRNEEGGAHVNWRYKRGTPTDKLARLMLGEYVDGYMEINGGTPQTSEPYIPAYATVRQIGWELEQTLRNARTDLIRRANFSPSPGPRMKPI